MKEKSSGKCFLRISTEKLCSRGNQDCNLLCSCLGVSERSQRIAISAVQKHKSLLFQTQVWTTGCTKQGCVPLSRGVESIYKQVTWGMGGETADKGSYIVFTNWSQLPGNA